MLYITTIAFNNPLFIEFQYKSFLKYLSDDFKFIVFDDSKQNCYTNSIKLKCEELNITYIRVDQNIHKDRNLVFKNEMTETRKKMIKAWPRRIRGYNNTFVDNYSPGSCHCASVQYIFNYFNTSQEVKDVSLLFHIDSDMFLVNEVNINELLENYDMGIVPQGNGGRVYIWPNVFILNFKKCKNLNEICWDGCRIVDSKNNWKLSDTGGETFHYLEKYYQGHTDKKILDLKSKEINSIDKINDLVSLKEIDEKLENLLKELFNLLDFKIFSREILLEYKGKNAIFHLRGYTWTNHYSEERVKKGIHEILNNFYK